MAVLRFFAALFLLVAAIALVADATGPITAAESFEPTSFLGHWRQFAPATLKTAEKFVSSRLAPLAWDPVITTLLSPPTFLIFGGAGLLAGYLGRRRQRINVFAN